MPHFFIQTTTGDRLVVVADSTAQAKARAASAGFARAARPPYRVEEFALRPYVGLFRLILPPVPAPPASALRSASRALG